MWLGSRVSIRLSALLVPFALAACGPKQSNPAGPYLPPFQSAPEAFVKELANAAVSCANPDECPTNVGLVVIAMQVDRTVKLGQCSGTLVGSDIVLMNSHCVPDEVKADPSLCKERLGFVQASGNHDRAACAELIIASKIDSDAVRPDYALIRLERKLTRAPTRIVTRGFKDQQAVSAFTVDPVSAMRIAGSVVKKTCTAVQNSILAPKFTHDLATVVSLFGTRCNVIPGNSGSGVLNSEGQIIGVISHGKKGREAQELWGQRLPDVYGLAANFGCLDLTRIGIAPNAACPDAADPMPDVFQSITSEAKLTQVLSDQAQILVDRAPTPFKYRVTMTSTGVDPAPGNEMFRATLTTFPKCVKPLTTWRTTSLTRTRLVGARNETYLSLSQNEEKLLIAAQVDAFVRRSLDVRREITAVSIYDLILEGAAQTLFSGYKEVPAGSGLPTRTPFTLSLCTEQELVTPYELQIN